MQLCMHGSQKHHGTSGSSSHEAPQAPHAPGARTRTSALGAVAPSLTIAKSRHQLAFHRKIQIEPPVILLHYETSYP
jgi:hypothetical protein